jgi:DNA invertase Pin-like site-specific DNA recombinase
MISNEKIRAEHLHRPAFVYVRQSSLTQVRHHHESRRRQYDLQDHARGLGWSQVVVIDDDLGKSGATAAGRPGFQRLVAEVSLGHAGAVIGLDVSRLARNNRDWYQLLDLCGLTNTLIIDGEGVYDPRQLNDRLLLGLKGTMSEAELGWIRQRAYEGLLAKARRGALILGLPVGYVQTRDGRIEKHPDQRVRQAMALVFEQFAAGGSVRQALLWFRQERVTLPSLDREPGWGERVTWRLPVYNTVLKILTNPTYAGTYAFGRTYTRTTVIDGHPHKTRGHRQPREQWIAWLRDHHEPYIPWDVYERNQQLIAHNAQMKGLMVKGAVRRGPSLLPGLLRCGHCGRRLHVSYSGVGGYVPRYSCRGATLNHGADRCISFGGLRVDDAIGRKVLRVLTPGAIEAASRIADSAAEEGTAVRRAVELELREARYAATVRRRRARAPTRRDHA